MDNNNPLRGILFDHLPKSLREEFKLLRAKIDKTAYFSPDELSEKIITVITPPSELNLSTELRNCVRDIQNLCKNYVKLGERDHFFNEVSTVNAKIAQSLQYWLGYFLATPEDKFYANATIRITALLKEYEPKRQVKNTHLGTMAHCPPSEPIQAPVPLAVQMPKSNITTRPSATPFIAELQKQFKEREQRKLSPTKDKVLSALEPEMTQKAKTAAELLSEEALRQEFKEMIFSKVNKIRNNVAPSESSDSSYSPKSSPEQSPINGSSLGTPLTPS